MLPWPFNGTYAWLCALIFAHLELAHNNGLLFPQNFASRQIKSWGKYPPTQQDLYRIEKCAIYYLKLPSGIPLRNNYVRNVDLLSLEHISTTTLFSYLMRPLHLIVSPKAIWFNFHSHALLFLLFLSRTGETCSGHTLIPLAIGKSLGRQWLPTTPLMFSQEYKPATNAKHSPRGLPITPPTVTLKLQPPKWIAVLGVVRVAHYYFLLAHPARIWSHQVTRFAPLLNLAHKYLP